MEATQNMSPEQMQEGMCAWMKWAEACGDGLVGMGSPLMGGLKIRPTEVPPATSELPATQSWRPRTWRAQKPLPQGHPRLGWAAGCEIEVHESMPMPM